MAQLSESRMNVAALKRVDPYVKDIVETAAHVALYTFNSDEWEKTEVEEPVTQGLDLHIQDPFLLYRTTRGGIFCIWFYDKDECTRIATALRKLVKETAQNSEKKNVKKLPKDGSATSSNGGNSAANVDIFSMLTKAQEEYNSKSPRRSESDKDVPESTPKSVMEFFAKASSGTQFKKDGPKPSLPTTILMGPRPLPPPGLSQMHSVPMGLPHQQGDVKIIQRLMSNPAHSVEHIEKQQRSITPQSELAALMRSKAPNLAAVNKDLGKNTVKNKPNLENKSKKPGQQSSNIQSQIDNGMGFLRINDTSPTPGPTTIVQTQNFFNTNLTKHSPVVNDINEIPLEQRSLSAPHGSALDATQPKPALMPPVMFTTSAIKDETSQILATNQNPLKPATNSASSTINLPANTNTKIRPEPLTQNQLLQAFNYLLKNDPDFMRLLHEAYVKSFSEMVS